MLREVTLQLPGQSELELDFLVDSGADVTTIPMSVLANFGLRFADLRPHGRTGTASGSAEQRLCKGQVAWRSRVFCREFAVLRGLRTPVVGQSDFFKVFRVDMSGWNQYPPTFGIYLRPGSRRRQRS